MPRAAKTSNCKTRSTPYQRPDLETLKRPALQALAKKEGIKANIKSEEIIINLLAKATERRSKSVSVGDASEDASPELAAGVQGRGESMDVETVNNLLQPTDGRSLDERSLDPIPEGEPEHSEKAHTDKTPPTLVPSREPSPAAAGSSHHEGDESDDDLLEGTYDPLTDREVRDIRRQLTTWQDEIVENDHDLEELQATHHYAERMLAEGADEAEKLMYTRMSFDMRVLRRLRWDRHLYDGTGQMHEPQRRKWEAFVEENWIVEERQRQNRHEDGYWSDEDNQLSGDSTASSLSDMRSSDEQEQMKEPEDPDDIYA